MSSAPARSPTRPPNGSIIWEVGWGSGPAPSSTNKRQRVCKPGSVLPRAGWAIIPLGLNSHSGSSNQPGRRAGTKPIWHPYSVLLPVGFAVPLPLPVARCALAAPFHPCLPRGASAVCSLWHFPWGRPRRRLAGTVVSVEPGLSSPPACAGAAIARPSGVFVHSAGAALWEAAPAHSPTRPPTG